jgi:hypothetical protein
MRTLLLIALFIGSFFLVAESQAAFTSPAPFSGYAWSSNIGWISFSGPGYGVQINTDFTVTGYAWSSNIGWIRFGGLSGCPSLPCEARVDNISNELLGWARACSATAAGNCTGPLHPDGGGWDGWIALSDPNPAAGDYGVTLSAGLATGYSWGSDVIGWINYNSGSGVTYLPPCDASDATCSTDLSGREIPNQWCTSTTYVACVPGAECNPATNACESLPITALLTVAPAAIRQGDSATVTWSTTNASSCTLEQQFPSGDMIQSWSGLSGSQPTAPIQGLTIFSLECTDALGVVTSEVASTTIRIIPNVIET